MLPDDKLRSPEWIDRIEQLVHRAEEIPVPHTRSIAIELSQAIMEFHRAALGRAMEMIAESRPEGEAIFASMAEDQLIASLLLVHDLHPEPTRTRVERAIVRLDQAFRSLGARLSLAGISGGVVCLSFESSRAWPGSQTRSSIEKFIFQSAPEIEGVVIEGMKEEPPPDFVPVSGLLAGSRP